MENWTKWQYITNLIVRVVSIGLHPGRCGVCGSWMIIDMVIPGVSGAVCPECDHY